MSKRSFLPVSAQVSESRYCHLATVLEPCAELRVALVGKELCNPDFQIARDDFPCYGLEFIARGVGQLVLDGNSYPLHAGVVFCYGPGIRHRISNHPSRRMTKYFVDFWGDEAASFFEKSKCRPGQAVQIAEGENLRTLFDQLLAEGTRKSGYESDICAAYLRIILLKTQSGTKPSPFGKASLFARFQRWCAFIETHYERLRDLQDIADGIAVRPAYLCRVFKHFGQSTPFQYLTQMKMNRAADRLVGARLSVKAAAQEVGYNDPYHFSRVFKKHFGLSPAHFTERHWRVTPGAQAAQEST